MVNSLWMSLYFSEVFHLLRIVIFVKSSQRHAHLFIQCPNAKAIWNWISSTSGVKIYNHGLVFMELCLQAMAFQCNPQIRSLWNAAVFLVFLCYLVC